MTDWEFLIEDYELSKCLALDIEPEEGDIF